MKLTLILVSVIKMYEICSCMLHSLALVIFTPWKLVIKWQDNFCYSILLK